MKKLLIIIYVASLLAGCSQEVVKQAESSEAPPAKLSRADKEKIAEQNFIDGCVLETKGQFNDAIAKYLTALKYDQKAGIYYTVAKNYFRLNKLSSAINFAQQAVKNDSGNVEYMTLLASIYSSSHLEDSSAAVYNQIIKLDSTAYTAYFSLAQIYEAKRPNEALKLYKKVIDLIGPEWSVLVRLVALNERMGNIQETVKMVAELVKLNPSNLQLQKVLIDAYIKTKEYDKALSMVNESLASFPDDFDLLELKGRTMIEKGDWKDASGEYLKLVANPQVNMEAKIRIGTSFFAASEKDSNNLHIAKEIFQTIDKDTADWQVNAYLGEIGIREKQDSIAIEYLKKAAGLAEWNAQVWVRLGGLLFDNRKYKDAISYMSKAYSKFPNDFAVNLIYGLALSQENDHLKAKEALQRALKINPDDVTALSAMGYTLNQLKNDEEALVYLQKALSIDPNNIQVLSITAMIHESKKEYKISDSLYTKALQLDSTNALILNNYAYSLSERGIDLQNALAMSKKAVTQEPKNASYLDTIGWIYFKLDSLDNAKKNVESAANMEEKNATILDHLGDIYFKLGQKEKAKQLWNKAFSLDQSKAEIKRKIDKGEL